MSAPLAPKFLVVDGFLPNELLESLDELVRSDARAMELSDLGGLPSQGYYSASRRVWLLKDGLAAFEPAFRSAVIGHLPEIFKGTGIAPFEVARVETQVCAQRSGSFFAKHVDTDSGEIAKPLSSDRVISAVYYFPREPLAFSGGELLFYGFTGRTEAARIAPRRNRLVTFPSFACHEVAPVTADGDSFEGARWSVNCWLHRARETKAASAAGS